MKTDCPKCKGYNAWFTRTRTDLILKCMCGYYEVVYTTLERIEIEHNVTGGSVRLPMKGTNLRKTLMVVSVMPEASSREITERLADMGEAFSVSDVASYLGILRQKGLVQQTEVRRGIAGGSLWILTDAATNLIGA
jgi:hypothetical protein